LKVAAKVKSDIFSGKIFLKRFFARLQISKKDDLRATGGIL